MLQGTFSKLRDEPRRVVFAEGEEEAVLHAAVAYVNQGLGEAILVGREARIREAARHAGIELKDGVSIHNAAKSDKTKLYTDFLYGKLARKGFLPRDCQRLVNTDRHTFAALMVKHGDADAMVSGATRHFSAVLNDVRRVFDVRPGQRVIGISLVLARGRTIVVADTAVTEMPDGRDLADIAEEAAGAARRLGYEPRVAFAAFSTFGQPPGDRAAKVQEAVALLQARGANFEFDGELAVDVALNMDKMAAYPCCALKGPANVLVMPALHSAAISTAMIKELGKATVIGPLIVGLEHSVQIAPLGAKDSDLVNMAALAAYDINF
jgi:malate dehydrogenase (oxaloacetate-decarboxylating)(NADP+)